MSDKHLRELDRRWRESGAIGDEAALLIGRVRAGQLDQQRLFLAAYLGHPAAGAAIGANLGELADLESWIKRQGQWDAFATLQAWISDWDKASGDYVGWSVWGHPPAEGWGRLETRAPSRIESWVQGFALWGTATCLRAGVAVLRRWSALFEGDERIAAEDAIDRCDAWLACPCEDHRRAALEGVGPGGRATRLCKFARDTDARLAAQVAGRTAHGLAYHLTFLETPGASLELLPAAVEEARAEITSQLLPWALEGVTRPVASIPGLQDALEVVPSLAGVEPDDLELLAWLGHPPARLAAGLEIEEARDLEQWVRGLEAYGAPPVVRACEALLELARERGAVGRIEEMVRLARDAEGVPGWALVDCVLESREAERADEEIRAAIRSSLVGWILGEDCP